jgi:hypothetical protein
MHFSPRFQNCHRVAAGKVVSRKRSKRSCKLFERDAGLAAHQEKIKNTKPDAGRCISELPLEVSVFALRLEVVGDFGSDLWRGCRDRPQIRRLPLRHLLYAASMPAARDEFFGDLFTNQERMVHRPAHSAGCGVPRGPIRRGSYVIEHHADRSMNGDRHHYSGHGCSSYACWSCRKLGAARPAASR